MVSLLEGPDWRDFKNSQINTSMETSFFIGFNLLVLVLLYLDLFIFNRKNHVVKIREAVAWSVFWIVLALVFNYVVFLLEGKELALEFLTAYLLEKSLSVDNLFVFILLFTTFGVPAAYQHKVLFWGVLGAIVMRAIFIFAGIALVEEFHYTVYLLGAFLVYGGIKSVAGQEEDFKWQETKFYKWICRYIPFSKDFKGDKFWVKEKGKLIFTPLFLALISIEISDLIFAVDSVPAILSISTDPFIVYTSNIFAILGLRALYFVLEGTLHYFHLLKYGIALILVFVGLKMVFIDLIEVDIIYSLIFIFTVLAFSVLLSLIFPKPKVSKEVAE